MLHFRLPKEKFLFSHWGRVTHICVGNITIIGSDSCLSLDRCQAIIWINDGILLIGPSGRKFSEILIKIHTFPFKQMHLKTSSRHTFDNGYVFKMHWRVLCIYTHTYIYTCNTDFSLMPNQANSKDISNGVKQWAFCGESTGDPCHSWFSYSKGQQAMGLCITLTS